MLRIGTMAIYLCIQKQQKDIAMNKEITLANICTMIASEASYSTLLDMINEMDLELMDISLA